MSRESRIVSALSKGTGGGGSNFILPNTSGDHVRSIKREAPVEDVDLANKKYVDDHVGVGTWTDTSTNTGTNKRLDDFSNRIESDEIHIEVRNESGQTMSKGDLVYISGYSVGQDKPLVTLADASNAATMPAIGMINDGDIVNNATGHLTNFGRVFDIDTAAFSIGDTVYVSTTAGEMSTRPSGQTDKVQAIGIVLRSQVNNGVIQITGAGRTNDIPNDIDHDSDLINVSADDHHAQSHDIASHSDTTGTGAELDTLTDNSMADSLHRHSELSASDGTPDQALVVGATGEVGIGIAANANYSIRIGKAGASLAHAVQCFSETDGHTPQSYLMKSHHTTLGSFGETGADDVLGELKYFGINSTSWESAGEIIVTQTGAASTSLPAKMEFNLSSSAAAAATILTLKRLTAVIAGTLTIDGDNGSADTAYVPMVLYNTDATPPTASGFPIGTLYVQYTA